MLGRAIAHVEGPPGPQALFDHQTTGEVAARFGVCRTWVYELRARYEAGVRAHWNPVRDVREPLQPPEPPTSWT
jgi:hypothetical protein